MNNILDTPKPLEHFFPRLATLDAVQVALRKEFVTHTPVIVNKLKTGQPLVDDELRAAYDIVDDLVLNESEVVETISWPNQSKVRSDDEDEFCVDIMRFGSEHCCVYWIQGEVADSSKCFDSMDDAKLYAEVMYIP